MLKAFERDANPNDTTLLSLVDRDPSHPPDSAGDADSKPDAEDDEDDDGGTQASRANRTSSHREADADLMSDEETEPEPKRSTTAAAARNSKSKAPTTQSSGVASSRNQKKTRNADADDDDDWDVSAIQETQSSTASTSRHQQSTTNEKRRGGGARGAAGTSMRRNVIPETDSEFEASQVRGERSGSVDLMDLDDNLPNSTPFARPKKASTRTSSTASAASSSGLGTAPVLSAPLRAAGKKPATIREEPDTDLIEVPSDDEEEEVQSSAPSKTKRSRGRPAAAASASSSRRGQKTQMNLSTFLDTSSSNVSAAPRTSTRMDGGRDISRLSFIQPHPGGRPPLTSTQKSSYTSYIQNSSFRYSSPLELKNV